MPVESTPDEVAWLVLTAVREPGTSFPGGADDELANGRRSRPGLTSW